ncbi:hypothetical protein MPSEU_000377400 [Mayamaea pseudoterrestris]|nr:hypothetical protein MPSEU_000377400 [Mayamaea pseudoterrestris]
MIVVFVVDTSPSMSRALDVSPSMTTPGEGPTKGGSLTRLDLAKMAVEDLSRRLRKGLALHQSYPSDPAMARSMANIGQGGAFVPQQDALLLLSTSRQHPDSASCAAGGRLLVGFGRDDIPVEDQQPLPVLIQNADYRLESFQKELKSLEAAKWDPENKETFPEDAGGAAGLNAALSTGLQLLSRYRLHSRYIENFGQGRLPCASMQIENESGRLPATALQPACLILVTDGACLRHSPSHGGGSLQLQYGSQPLREFYKEPFRWDQRIFCLAVGDAPDSKQYVHPQLRALVEVTGGSHFLLRHPSTLPTDAILKRIRPLMPRELPLSDPLFAHLPTISYSTCQSMTPAPTYQIPQGASFVNAGPIICLQALEGEENGRPTQRRAMLLYTSSLATSTTAQIPQLGNELKTIFSPPLWCIPESFFPSKKLDALPPRSAQPLLFYSKHPANLGSKSFDPLQVIKVLHRLDQLVLANRKAMHQQARVIHRDVYICDWLSAESEMSTSADLNSQNEYFPVFVRGAGRSTLSDDADSFIINIGILHAPLRKSAIPGNPPGLTTLTMLPPEPHILLPLLLRATEAEHRAVKKLKAKQALNNSNKLNVILDDNWRSEFQAYLFRLPPYYQSAMKRCLRPVLPACAHAIFHSESIDSVMQQCFSKACLQKIRNGEQMSRDTNDMLEKQESCLYSVRIQQHPTDTSTMHQMPAVKYGNFDIRTNVDTYLQTLRSLPPPWQLENYIKGTKTTAADVVASTHVANGGATSQTVLDVLGDLPEKCLMAYYESRRRWIFGGPPLTTRGLHVEGVNNGGSNVQRCGGKAGCRDGCLLSLAGVGVSMLNETSTTRMGDYKERLIYSRAPIVGYGSNDAAGVAATTASDGSPVWSVDDAAMPQTFFDERTGDFSDGAQARSLSKLLVNFGNPFREKRADSLIPARFLSQTPSLRRGEFAESATENSRTPPGSPPHISFDSVEEGEALFVTRKSPSRLSPKRDAFEDADLPTSKRQRANSRDEQNNVLAPFSTPSKHSTPSLIKPHTILRPALPGAASAAPAPPRPPKPPVPNIGTNRVPASRPAAPARPPPTSIQLDRRKSMPPTPLLSSHEVNQEPNQGHITTHLPSNDPLSTATAEDLSNDHEPCTQNTSAQVIFPAVPNYECPDKPPNINLLPDWICVWSKSQKRWYFWHKKTNQSLWNWPPDG